MRELHKHSKDYDGGLVNRNAQAIRHTC